MYKEYFGLAEYPFSIVPDPRYLYMSERHREALAHLLYGIRSDGGFVLLTGEVGTGKTTVCRCLLEQMPDNADVAFILNPKLTVDELLATICDELRIAYPADNKSVKVFVDLINAYLLDCHAAGRRTILIIEEAQNLDAGVLEQIRLLTNLETNRQKLLQIIMVGQPELKDLLSRPEMRQLSQRITARYHLGALSRRDVSAYLAHRLSVAGLEEKVFSAAAIDRLYRLSGGIPRLINLICDRGLLGAYAGEKRVVDASILKKAAREVLGCQERKEGGAWFLRWAPAALLLLLFAGGVAALYSIGAVSTEAGKSDHSVKTSEAGEIETSKPHVVQTLRWPDGLPIGRSADMAHKALFEAWNVPYPGSASACSGAGSHGLNCLRGLGSLETLKRLNRPAVLKLFDSSGREYSVFLKKVDGVSATFVLGTEQRNVDLKEVEKWWYGDYTILCKTPPQFAEGLKPGARGAGVRWLNEQLALVEGLTPPERTDAIYDENLVRQVKRFQLSRGLVPDGIAGPQTIMQLSDGEGGPTLRVEGG